MILLQNFEYLRKKLVIGSKTANKMKFGTKLPNVAQKKASIAGSFSTPIPNGMAPLSSVKGIIAVRKVSACGDIVSLSDSNAIFS